MADTICGCHCNFKITLVRCMYGTEWAKNFNKTSEVGWKTVDNPQPRFTTEVSFGRHCSIFKIFISTICLVNKDYKIIIFKNWTSLCTKFELLWLSILNPLDSKGNYSGTSNYTKLVHWPLIGGLLYLVQRWGAWAGCGPAQSPPRCTKCNSPPINGQCSLSVTVLLYDGPLLYGFNAAMKWLSNKVGQHK